MPGQACGEWYAAKFIGGKLSATYLPRILLALFIFTTVKNIRNLTSVLGGMALTILVGFVGHPPLALEDVKIPNLLKIIYSESVY